MLCLNNQPDYDNDNDEHDDQMTTKQRPPHHKEWFDIYGELFARLRDFYVIEEDKNDPICNCNIEESGYSQDWARRIVKETSDKYQCIDN